VSAGVAFQHCFAGVVYLLAFSLVEGASAVSRAPFFITLTEIYEKIK
jgi:hypothetical protein